MKKVLGVIVAGGALVILVGAATAHWSGGPGHGRGGGMGYGGMGGHGMGWRGGSTDCPGYGKASTAQITEEKAKELAQKYADQYLPTFKVERVLPFTGRRHTMYSVELKNPEGELRTFHINPFGNVMPFGAPWRHSS